MESVDFSARRPPVPAARAEVDKVARLRLAYERMLGRLEDERARTASAVLQAQENERARVARDLRDEANQAPTEISELLGLSERTVEHHRSSILRKLGMRDRVELVRYAIRRGLVEPGGRGDRRQPSPVGTTPAASTISTDVRTGACVQCMTPRGTV
jgi:DNA-binding CsgD family transcriptional regulator